MNQADTAACTAVAHRLAEQLLQHGHTNVQVLTERRYHGRTKAFIDTLRSYKDKGLQVA